MTHIDPHPSNRKRFTARRATLLASSALVVAVLFAGADYHAFTPPYLGSIAHAAEVQAQQPAGFADLVEKVKPAVVSVRVKMEQPSSTSEDHQRAAPPGIRPKEPPA